MARRDAIAWLFLNLAQELPPLTKATNLFGMQPDRWINDNCEHSFNANAIPCVVFLNGQSGN